MLIPQSADPALLDLRSRTAAVDQNGTFAFETIAPGAYRLYAFEKISENDWDDPDFLKQLQPDAQTASLTADKPEQVTLSLIPSQKTEAILAALGLR